MRSGLSALVPVAAVVCGLTLTAGPVRADGKQMPQHKITQAKSYLALQPMYATIIDNGRPVGLLLVAIGLNIPDADLRDRTVDAMPILYDSYVRSLMSFTAAAVRPWEQPDVNLISTRLQHVTDRVLRSKGAQVLLSQVVIRISR